MILYVAKFQLLTILVSSTSIKYTDDPYRGVTKRALQHSHEKPRIEKLSEFFLEKDLYLDDPDLSLINLLNEIADLYLSGCTTVILYDNFTASEDHVFLTKFFQQYRSTYLHANIPADHHLDVGSFINQKYNKCVHFIIFIKDVMKGHDVIYKRSEKVVIVSKSSQWRVQEFLCSKYSQEIPNLLVIVKSDKFLPQKQEMPYILYTHKLFVDALGSSEPVVLVSWAGGNFSRNVSLFPTKLKHGLSGHRFVIAAASQPPYVVIKQRNDKNELEYDGIEIKLVNLLSKMYNFSTDYQDSSGVKRLGSGVAVIKAIKRGNVNIGVGGLYITDDRYDAGVFHWHSEDCASFISLASTALPRYRAIMGPFQWTVWLALTLVYLLAILLFSYSDRATLRHLIKNPEEFENMFWYVFGTFTNCFTFTGNRSWTKANKTSTKLLVGIYWLFTIIITASYTGSIIAFVTLPVFPTVVDTVDQLLGGRFQIGILDKGGWPNWFHNITDKASQKLLWKIDYVPDVESGIRNVTKAFFWPYALLGSREQLNFIVKTNFSVGSKRSVLHISQQCFIPFKVGIILPTHSVYSEILAKGIQLILQSGILLKMKSDIEWDTLRSATGKLLAANSRMGSLKALRREDRALTLDDTQGMFLLLLIGFLVSGAVLASEIFGGCFNLCKKSDSRAVSSNSSIPSNPRFHERQTNRERHRSISLTHHPQKPRTSLVSSETQIDSTNIEKYFGERLVHDDIFQVSPYNEHPGSAAAGSESSGSQVDYNEEITKMFTHALETESYNSNNESIDGEENIEVMKKTKLA